MRGYRLRIEKRMKAGPGIIVLVTCTAVVLGFLCAGLLFMLRGVNPFVAIGKILGGSFGSIYGIKETIAKSIPLILCSVGLTAAFRARFWNIGAEGQLLAGAIGATFVALNSGNMPAFLVIPVMFVVGAICGALWGSIAAVLKVRLGINEVISTLMLNYIIAECVQYLVYGPWKGATQYGFPYTDNFPCAATLHVIPGSRIHILTLVISCVAAALVWFVISRTTMGFAVRMSGESPDAAKYAGIRTGRVTIGVVALSGALAGLAGVGEVAGIHHHLSYPWSISSGYGFTAIIAAWLARLNPVLAILSSFFLSGILVGGDTIQTALNLPAAAVNVFNGSILFFLIGSEFFISYRVVLKRRAFE